MVRFYLGVAVVLGLCLLGVADVEANEKGHQQCVCEDAGLIGGAYAACNRYCEVLNCDAANPNGSGKACDRVLERFFDLTGEMPPCEPVCPCAEAWLNPEFIPEGEVQASCYVEISDLGKYIDLVVEGSPDGAGDAPMSFAATDIFDDTNPNGPYYRVGCISERTEGAELSEDSGAFEMISVFADESRRFDRQQRRIFKACKKVLKRVVRKSGAECEVVDLRTD